MFVSDVVSVKSRDMIKLIQLKTDYKRSHSYDGFPNLITVNCSDRFWSHTSIINFFILKVFSALILCSPSPLHSFDTTNKRRATVGHNWTMIWNTCSREKRGWRFSCPGVLKTHKFGNFVDKCRRKNTTHLTTVYCCYLLELSTSRADQI